MKQIKCLKSSLQRRGNVHVYKMADGADVNRKCVLFFSCSMGINSLCLCLRLLCRLLHCCFEVIMQTLKR